MENRRSLLVSSVSLALFFVLLTSLAAIFPAQRRETTRPVNAVQPVQEAAGIEPEKAGYLIRTMDDEVCIFQGDVLYLRTGVTASLLPRQDREALAKGITVSSREELTSLLEDLGS